MKNGTFGRLIRQPGGGIGLVLLIAILALAALGPLLGAHSPTEPLSSPSTPPGNGFLLGTDYLGRDVLSRLLHGGRSVILIGLSATSAAYIVGIVGGMCAGYFNNFSDTVIMRAVDVILAFPPLLVLLLLVSGLHPHVWVLVLGVVIVQIPAIARLTRATSLSVSKSSYVEAARVRGDSTLTIWRRDLLRNIMPTLLADFGIRFSISIILVASMNFLGLGLAPPASDWGLMISENQSSIILNPMAVIAPAVMLALLTISVNMVADAYVRASESSGRGSRRRKAMSARMSTPVATIGNAAPEVTL